MTVHPTRILAMTTKCAIFLPSFPMIGGAIKLPRSSVIAVTDAEMRIEKIMKKSGKSSSQIIGKLNKSRNIVW